MASLTQENWRDVVGFEGKYEVSNLGRVRSLCCGRIKVLKLGRHGNGYRTVTPGGRISKLVHRLVAMAWIGPIPNDKEVNHIDGDKANNRVENLEYVTRRGNVHHAIRTGLMLRDGQDNPATSVRNQQVIDGYNLVAKGVPVAKACCLVGISQSCLRSAVTGNKWKSLGLKPIKTREFSNVPEKTKCEIVKLHRNGFPESAICEKLGVSKGTVYRAIKRARST